MTPKQNDLILSSHFVSTRLLNHYKRVILLLPPTIRVNASGGLKGSTIISRANFHTRRKFNNRENKLKEQKELYLQRRAKERQRFEDQLGDNLEFLNILDVKECILEI